MNINMLESWIQDAPLADAIPASTYVQILRDCLKEIKQLQTENKELKHEIGDWLRWCGYLEESHRPTGLIKTSTQLLKKYTNA